MPMPPIVLPWMAAWLMYWSAWLPPAPKPAEVIDLASWRKAKAAGRR